MNFKRTVLLFLSVVLVSAAIVGAQAPADPNLVYVTVEVFKPGNVPVTGLKKENFTLLEDRIAQTIAVFEEDNQTNTYRIAYVPAKAARDGSWRAIRVNLSDPAGTIGTVSVRSKAGYYAR